MNIFEQYGIKEVADCTLYAISLDKYDDEVYIPIMYFDTLKVSSIEQTAEQTSAKGGLGNPDLITWDYGKEITVSLEDALYTPASQSLIWGGLFGLGKTKIYGAWDPYIYEKDQYGRTQYLIKEVLTGTEYEQLKAAAQQLVLIYKDNKADIDDGNFEIGASQLNNARAYLEKYGYSNNITLTSDSFLDFLYALYKDYKSYIQFICPCDGNIKYMRYIQNTGWYKSKENLNKDDENRQKTINGSSYTQIIDGSTYNVFYDNQKPRLYYKKDMSPYFDKLECAELILENYGSFIYQGAKYSTQGTRAIEESFEPNSSVYGLMDNDCNSDATHYIYQWKDADIRIVSTDGNLDTYFAENVDIKYISEIGGTNKNYMISGKTPYIAYTEEVDETTVNFDDLFTIDDFINEDLEANKIIFEADPYDSKITLYQNIKWSSNNQYGDKIDHYTRVIIGTFYIVKERNESFQSAQDLMHPINSGLEDVYYIDRMEKCKATQTFAINTDRNTQMHYYSQLPEYAQTALTVYIDPKTMKPFEPNSDCYRRKNGGMIYGNLRIIKQYDIYYKWTRSRAPEYMSLGHRIIVDAEHFPGTYRLVGETYSRSRRDGKDQRYQFEIPLCKMDSNTNLTLEAAGEPTTFSMNMKVMRREDGVMMKLTQYNIEQVKYDGYCSGSTEIVPIDILNNINETCEKVEVAEETFETETKTEYGAWSFKAPDIDTVYCTPQDCLEPYEGEVATLNLATASDSTMDKSKNDKDRDKIKISRPVYTITTTYKIDSNGNKTKVNENRAEVEEILTTSLLSSENLILEIQYD